MSGFRCAVITNLSDMALESASIGAGVTAKGVLGVGYASNIITDVTEATGTVINTVVGNVADTIVTIVETINNSIVEDVRSVSNSIIYVGDSLEKLSCNFQGLKGSVCCKKPKYPYDPPCDCGCQKPRPPPPCGCHKPKQSDRFF